MVEYVWKTANNLDRKFLEAHLMLLLILDAQNQLIIFQGVTVIQNSNKRYAVYSVFPLLAFLLLCLVISFPQSFKNCDST